MTGSVILSEEGIIILLLAIAIVMSIILRKVRFPSTIGLFLIGFFIAYIVAPNVGFLSPISGYVPNSDLILYLFLPPLIFESAISLNSRFLFKNSIPVMGMAVVGVVISVCVIGLLLSSMTAIPLIYALLFGAVISATDPVAVIALFKDLGVPKRLFTLVEGESLLNDASAIVSFNIILGFVAIQAYSANPSVGDIAFFFTSSLLLSFAGGILIGSIMAGLLYGTIRASPDHPYVHETISLVIAYSAFLISEAVFDFSGVVAVVTAGILVSRMSSRRLGPAVREDLHKFWSYIGFLANSMIFMLVGISVTGLGASYIFSLDFVSVAAIVIAAVLTARAVSVYGVYSVTNILEKDRPVPRSFQTIIFWGGIRGAVCLALVLSLPADFPYHDIIVGFTILVVMFTIIIQGMTTGPLIRFFGLQRPETVLEFEKLWLSIKSARESLETLRAVSDDSIPAENLEEASSRYEIEIEEVREKFGEFWRRCPDDASIRELFWIKAIEHEKEGYRRLYDRGIMPPGVLENLIYDADTRMDKILAEEKYPSGIRYYSPVLIFGSKVRRRVSSIFGRSPLKNEKHEFTDRLFLTYAISVVAAETREWVLNVADETGSGRVIIDPVVEEYDRMHESAKTGFLELGAADQEAAGVFYSYIASRTAISGAKEMVLNAMEYDFFDENEVEAELVRLRKEESAAGEKITEL